MTAITARRFPFISHNPPFLWYDPRRFQTPFHSLEFVFFLLMRRRLLLPLGLFLGLALIATWPLIARLTTHVPGSDTWAYDEYTFIWSMWWFKHSMIDGAGGLFFSPNIFYPLGMELILYSYNLMGALLALPLGLAANWPAASNLTLLFSTVISGFGAYLLSLWLLTDDRSLSASTPSQDPQNQAPNPRPLTPYPRAAALLAGIIYAFASNRMVYLALGHYNIQSWQFVPFFLLYLLRLMAKPSPRNAMLAGLFGAMNLLVDMQYGVFMAFLALCLVFTQPLRRRLFRQPGAARRWLALAGAGVVAILLTLPYFWDTVRSFSGADFLLKGWGDALKLSADLAGWFTPTALHPLWGGDWTRTLRAVQEGAGAFADVNTVFLGYITVLLALIGGVVVWKRSRGWIVAAALSATFTLGPLLQVRGRYLFDFDGLQSSVPLPFLLLHYIPFVKGNRAANRWSIVLMLALAMLAAWARRRSFAACRRARCSDATWFPVSWLSPFFSSMPLSLCPKRMPAFPLLYSNWPPYRMALCCRSRWAGGIASASWAWSVLRLNTT